MSTINDEITRIKGAKNDLRNSIEAKGVSVDPDFTIDKYSICVDQIAQGANLTTLSATSNTTYRPTSPYDGYSEVTVNVQPNLTTLNATSNNTYTPTAPAQGFSSVTVNVPQNANLTTLNATSNNTYTPSAPYDGYNSVTVNVQPNLTTLNATSNNTYIPSPQYDGFSSVTVAVPQSAANLTTLTVNADGTYTPTAPYDGYNEVIVNTGGGSNESYITIYYLNTPETNFGSCNSQIFRDTTNVTAVYIDGVQQNSLNPTYRPTDWKMHEIKVVFDPDNNYFQSDMLNNIPVVAIDYSHFTGAVCNEIEYQSSVDNRGLTILPDTVTTSYSANFANAITYVQSAATAGSIHHSCAGICYKYNVVSPYDELAGRVLVDKTTHEVVFALEFGNVDLPAGTTSFGGNSMFGNIYAPDTVTNFQMIYYGMVYYFKGTTPPAFTPGGYMDINEGAICVPKGCVAAYKAALADTGDPTYADAVREVGTTTIYFSYPQGYTDDYIDISLGWTDGKRLFEVEIYDDQDTMIYSQPFHGNQELRIPLDVLNGIGDYYLKIYYDAKLESFPNGGGGVTTTCVTELDFNGINSNSIPRYSACWYANLLKITVPDNVDTLLNNFGSGTPELKEVWLDSPTMVNLPENDYFVVNTPRAQPVQVMVHGLSDYQNDPVWADLESRGLITLVEI